MKPEIKTVAIRYDKRNYRPPLPPRFAIIIDGDPDLIDLCEKQGHMFESVVKDVLRALTKEEQENG